MSVAPCPGGNKFDQAVLPTWSNGTFIPIWVTDPNELHYAESVTQAAAHHCLTPAA
jgi:hypothetical protein